MLDSLLSPHQFIPDSYQNPHASDQSAYRAYDEMVAAKGTDVPEWSSAPTEYLHPRDLTHTQPILHHANLESLRSAPPIAGKVIRANGKNYLQDGHHRAHLAAESGSTFPAQVWNAE